jgi:hypothetical protein
VIHPIPEHTRRQEHSLQRCRDPWLAGHRFHAPLVEVTTYSAKAGAEQDAIGSLADDLCLLFVDHLIDDFAGFILDQIPSEGAGATVPESLLRSLLLLAPYAFRGR